ncbi:ATP-binding protein [Nocardia nova]|nr:ATP-binding protein [Nocardia nova]
MKSLLDEVAAYPDEAVAVAVAGWKAEWEQVAKLCAIARAHSVVSTFEASMSTDRRWSKGVGTRLTHMRKMVAAIDDASASDGDVLVRTWGLLRRLRILGFHVQNPNTAGWTTVATSLDTVAAATADGVQLRDRLAVLAGDYDAIGGVVDLDHLRAEVHLLLDAPATRTKQAWDVLAQHRAVLFGTVRGTLGPDIDGATPLALPFSDRRAELETAIRTVASDAGALLVAGPSGTGKSALVRSVLVELESAESSLFEAAVVSFRELPSTSPEVQHLLGVSMRQVLAELSAPQRVLLIDGVDAAVDRSAGVLRDLLAAAAASGVGVVAVTADYAADFVGEELALGRSSRVRTLTVECLNDDEIAHVAECFPLLRGLLRNLPAGSLLRRLIVLDLLSRTGLELDKPMSEWECLQLIWSKLVRGDGRPNRGSAQAREDTLLALATTALSVPDSASGSRGVDPAAVDALRADHLIAPSSTYHWRPRFAHDEVRRYATAICLVRAPQIAEILQTAGVPRWALSAAVLACKGRLNDPDRRTGETFQSLLTGFRGLTQLGGARWRDVPVEAVLDTPAAYECMKASVEDDGVDLRLPDVLRVLRQRFSFNSFIDRSVGTPVVQYLIGHDEPWTISQEAFEVLTNWLQALVLSEEPAGNSAREALRARLVTFWKQVPQNEESGDLLPDWVPHRRRRRKVLDYRVTTKKFVEALALLGLDIDTESETCLRTVARNDPISLGPAADEPFSARSIAQRDPELLALLVEAYYIDEDIEDNLTHRDGIRDHQGQWRGFGGPFAAYYFGGFWQLFNSAPFATSVRVLNKVVNHAAHIRMRDSSERVELAVSGEPREYVGDGAVWAWYRGTSTGPYPCMSALQAMERIAEELLNRGVPAADIARQLLENCENLAVPGMLWGLFCRNLETAGSELDRFLAEPAVWSLESSRVTVEFYGFRASDEGLAHPERRLWTAREASVWLMAHGDEQRRAELRCVGEELAANGERHGFQASMTMNWAANLDESRYRMTTEDGATYLEVVPPPEVVAAQADIAAYQARANDILRLQNRYWGSRKFDEDYQPPTATEIANDLGAIRTLLGSGEPPSHIGAGDTAAQVVRTAIERVVRGEPDALGDEGAFAIRTVMSAAEVFRDSGDLHDEGYYFDLGADRAAAHALPALLTPALAQPLSLAAVTLDQVTQTGLALARNAPRETRLFLARGCDVIWASPCSGSRCIHDIAFEWMIESARNAEVGPWDFEAQHTVRTRIEGDLTERLKGADDEAIDLEALDPLIRAMGAAATFQHCATSTVQQVLTDLLTLQPAVMVRQNEDHRARTGENHTLVAARALLQNFAVDGAPRPIFDYLDILRPDAGILSGFLQGLAAAGAENDALAEAARALWPALLMHALTYVNDDPSVYKQATWGAWAAEALLPNPPAWAQGLYNELSGPPIDWIDPSALIGPIERWLPVGRGEHRCLEALIRLVRKLPIRKQATQGLSWVTEVCLDGDDVKVYESWSSDDWLKQIRAAADEHGTLAQWQRLVDALVVAGNSSLAPYST